MQQIKKNTFLLGITCIMFFPACEKSIIDTRESSYTNEYLTFKNYLGNSENIHPKVLYFPNGLWGWKYWMAYTPYPLGATQAENPCIAVSNDGLKWEKPKGLTNPLAFPPPNSNGGYNSDTHLVYREDLGILECWYRPVKLPFLDAIVRRTTADGVNWTNQETIIDYGKSYNNILSPSIIFEDGKYKMWYCNGKTVHYRETTSSTIDNWTNPVILPIEWEDLSAWHLDVINNKTDGYEMIVCAYDLGGTNNTADLYFVKQLYNGEYTKPIAILNRSTDPKAIDYRSIYRSSFLKIKGIYYIYYSCIDDNWHRYMALAYGSDILKLKKHKS